MSDAANGTRKGDQQEGSHLDIWEFVSCERCHLAFSSNGANPPVPFWLTECGHILCNSHLNPDRSCQVCNAQQIEVIPLQRQLPAPMSDWFCSIPHRMDALAQAAKFQHECLASSVRYYKRKAGQYREFFNRMRGTADEIKQLRSEIDDLRRENDSLRKGNGLPPRAHLHQETSSNLNANGKRRMEEYQTFSSSPRNIVTPLGPPRITLPLDHDPPPAISASKNGQGSDGHYSRGSIQKYAYIPPETAPPPGQANMARSQMRMLHQDAAASKHQSDVGRRLMPPPPTPIGRSQMLQTSETHYQAPLSRGRQGAEFSLQGALPNSGQLQQQQNSAPSGYALPRASTSQQILVQPRSNTMRFTPVTALAANGTSSGPQFVPSTPHGQRINTQRFVPQAAPSNSVHQPSTIFGGSTPSRRGTSTSRTAFQPSRSDCR